jgi:uncharacterized membrane protein (DUF485 family)
MAHHAGSVHGASSRPQNVLSAEEARRAAEWSEIEQESDFRGLVAAKRSFIIPATLFFIVYYFALPVLVGYFPALMEINVVGHINIAYLFALSQFFMAWIIMILYIRRARLFDDIARRITERVRGGSR